MLSLFGFSAVEKEGWGSGEFGVYLWCAPSHPPGFQLSDWSPATSRSTCVGRSKMGKLTNPTESDIRANLETMQRFHHCFFISTSATHLAEAFDSDSAQTPMQQEKPAPGAHAEQPFLGFTLLAAHGSWTSWAGGCICFSCHSLKIRREGGYLEADTMPLRRAVSFAELPTHSTN